MKQEGEMDCHILKHKVINFSSPLIIIVTIQHNSLKLLEKVNIVT